MRDGWRLEILGEISEVIMGRQLSPSKKLGTRPRPYIRAANIGSWGISLNEIFEMDFTEDEEARFASQIGDTLLVEGGNEKSVGCPGLVTENEAGLCIQNTVIRCRVKNPEVFHPEFQYQVLRYMYWRRDFAELCAGTTIMHLGQKRAELVPILLPPLAEQKRIVDLISTVDSYIEALQQQQNFAKQMLQALCQKTFLAEGDFVPLHTVATCIMGQSPEGFTCNKDGFGTPLLTGPTEFQRNNWVGPPRQWTTNETKISISQDILFCVRGATAGRMNLTNYRSVIGRGLAAIRCEDPMDTHFVRFALKFGLNQLLPSAGGTIFPNISQTQLRGFKLPWPNETERRSLAHLLKSVEDNAETLDQNVSTTKNLRSSLLHDLLSGEHQIPESYDKVMGAA